MKKLIVGFCLIFGITSYAQCTEEEYLELLEQSVLDEEYGQFTKDLVKFYTSEEYMFKKYYDKTFFDKLGAENVKQGCITPVTAFNDWVKDNLSKTKFTSAEEAVSLYTNFWKYERITQEFMKRTQPIEDMYKQKYGLVIHHDFMNDLSHVSFSKFTKFLEERQP